MTRHPLARAGEHVRYGCITAILLFCAAVLFLSWPLLLGMTTDAAGVRHVKGWTWTIEIPWLAVALVVIISVARTRRRR